MATFRSLLKSRKKTNMKKTILAILCLALTTIGFAQKIKPTPAVEKSFMQKFPNAKEIKWDKEGKDEYEAEFMMDGKKGSANFSAAGLWMETEMAIPQASTPKPVMDAFTKNFKTATITEVYKIESKEGKNYFEIEYTQSGKKSEAKISADGKLMK